MAFISLLILSFINGIFILKYSSRIIALEYAYGISICLPVIACISYYYKEYVYTIFDKIQKKSGIAEKKQVWVLLCTIVVLWVLCFVFIPKETLRVDRWLMIKTFWDNVFAGNYPYTPLYSNNVPGQLPMYHILAFPFHIVGEVGLLSLSVFLLLIWGIVKFNQTEKKSFSLRALLWIWLLSPALWWESATRSTIVMNMNLMVLFFLYNEVKTLSPIKKGIISGLLTATRSSVIIPLSTGVLGDLIREKKWSELIKVGFLTGFVPILSLIVLYFWNSELFFLHNPLAMQSLFLPTWLSVLMIGISIVLGIRAKDFDMKLWNSGLMLFLTVFTALCFALFKYGWKEAIFADAFDISYFLQAVPFFMIQLSQRKE